MFVVRVQLKIRENQRERLRAYVTSETAAARSLPGCEEYAFCEDISDPLRVLLYEEWATRSEFEAYKASAIFAASGAALGPMLAEPPRSAYYESEDVFASCKLDLPV
ncbi:MAG: putative quinol monooxygenase [Polyangiaceae bacterium]